MRSVSSEKRAFADKGSDKRVMNKTLLRRLVMKPSVLQGEKVELSFWKRLTSFRITAEQEHTRLTPARYDVCARPCNDFTHFFHAADLSLHEAACIRETQHFNRVEPNHRPSALVEMQGGRTDALWMFVEPGQLVIRKLGTLPDGSASNSSKVGICIR